MTPLVVGMTGGDGVTDRDPDRATAPTAQSSGVKSPAADPGDQGAQSGETSLLRDTAALTVPTRHGTSRSDPQAWAGANVTDWPSG
jgi:hypothetical protein